MQKGVTLPNRQWDNYTTAELAALVDLQPSVLVVLLYGGEIDRRHIAQLPTFAGRSGVRWLARPYANNIPQRDPVAWANECRQRVDCMPPGTELIPANEMNLAVEGGSENWLAHVRWLTAFAQRWRQIGPSIPLHLPALSPSGTYQDGYRFYKAANLGQYFDVADVHIYGLPLTSSLFTEVYLPGKPLSVTEFNRAQPSAFFGIAEILGGVREACWFILGGTPDQAAYDLLTQPSYYQSFKEWQPMATNPPPTPTIASAPGYPAVDRAKIFEYATWSMARIHNNEDPRDVGAYLQHLKDLGADPTRVVDYGLPYELTRPLA